MRPLLLLLLMITTSSGYAVSKQDIQLCQALGNQQKTAVCIASLKNNKTRNAMIACSKDLKCWSDQHRSLAQYNCDKAFKRAASSSQQWRKVWSGQKLKQARWLSRSNGTLTYFSDKNGIRIECRFDPRLPARVKTRFNLSPG